MSRSNAVLPDGLYIITNIETGQALEVPPRGPISPLAPLPLGINPSPFVLQVDRGTGRYFIRYVAYSVISNESKVFGSLMPSPITWQLVPGPSRNTFAILSDQPSAPPGLAWTLNKQADLPQVTLEPARGGFPPAQLFKIVPLA